MIRWLLTAVLTAAVVVALSGAAIIRQDKGSVTYIEVCQTCGNQGSKVTRPASTIQYSFRCVNGHHQLVSLKRVP